MPPFPIPSTICAALVLILSVAGYLRTKSPSALISGGVGGVLMFAGIGLAGSTGLRWLAILPFIIVALAFFARGLVSLQKHSPAAGLILIIAVIAAIGGGFAVWS